MRGEANKSHPKYPEYIDKCRKLAAEYDAKRDAVEKEYRTLYPDWKGKDSPMQGEFNKIDREHNVKLSQLKDEYAVIFQHKW